MMKFSAVSLTALLLVACGDTASVSAPDADTTMVDAETTTAVDAAPTLPADLAADDKVLVTVDRLVPEPEACLVMMSVVNGTDETVTAGLFAFNVTGNGESAGANMFPQTAEPNSQTTAQIVLPGADCDDALLIEGGELNCKIAETGESCMDAVELRDGVVDFSANN